MIEIKKGIRISYGTMNHDDTRPTKKEKTKAALLKNMDNVMKLTDEQFEALFWGNEPDSFKIEDDGEWINDCKYDYKIIVFSYAGKFWQISDSRTGSYYTDYSYGSEYGDSHLNAIEVKKVEVTKYEYRTV